MGKCKINAYATAFLAASCLLLSSCSDDPAEMADDEKAAGETASDSAGQSAEGDAAQRANEDAGQDGFESYADDAAIDQDMLRLAAAPFFEDSALGRTHALVIMHGGIVVAERYAPGITPETPLIGWSMSSTLTATLLGMMVADGRLSLDQAAPVSEWQNPGDPRAKITMRHLLHMTSGLDHSEIPTPENGKALHEVDTSRLLFMPDGRDNVARYAETRILEAAPGTHFEYSTPSSHILADIMTRILTDSSNADMRKNAMLQFARGRLFEPLGMDSMTPEFDRSGTMLGGSMIHGSARDWAKLAEFLRNNGSVKGAQLLPTGWTRFMRSSSDQDIAFGGHLWLNRHRKADRDPILFPDRAPDDVFAMLGYRGQFAVVSPQHKLVIVRMGDTSAQQHGAINDEIAKLIDLFPKKKK